MGAKSKKSASKADAIVAEPTKSIKKGKRDAEEIIEKHAVSSKKQKKDVKKVVPKKAAADVVNKPVKESTSDESDSSSDDDEPKKPVAAAKNGTVAAKKKAESSSKEEEEAAKKPVPAVIKAPAVKKVIDPVNSKTPEAAQTLPQTTGSKTVHLGNLRFVAEKQDVIDFFKDAGKVVEVNFVGYAHVTFATPDAAQKALKLNGKDLVGRPVELDLPKGRGAKTQPKKDVKKQKEPKPTRKSIEESDSHDSSSSSESEEEKGPKRTRQYIEGAADDDIADTSTEESDSSHDTTSSEALLLAYYAKQIDSSEEEMADAEPTKSIKKGKRDAKKAIEEKVGICKKQKVVKPQKEPKPTTIRGERIEGADIDDIAPTTSEESVFSQDVRSSSEISSLEAAMLAEYVDNDSEEEMLKSFSSKRVSKDSTKSKESSDDDESLDDDEDTPVPVKTASAKPAANVEESSESEEEESEKEEEEGSNEEDEPKTVKKKKVTDVEMVDAPSAAKKAPQTPATGSKTLFMGNLSFSIEENDVINFFKDAGEVVQVRFAMRDNCFAGYGHVEFATPDAAQKALELNGEDLVGRAVKLDFAKERGGAYTQGGFSGGRGGGGRFGGRDGGGGRGRGRGPSRPSMATLGTGKKTTFGDD